MAIIRRFRRLAGAGILADKGTNDDGLEFLRHNLIYGFNGSGKSTLSRILACLEIGKRHAALPDECSFEIEMDDGSCFGSPDELSGLEDRVCVFNTDFIERNLQWASGRANSIFYISEEQAELAAELKAAQELVAPGVAARDAQSKLVAAADKSVRNYRTERARFVSGTLNMGNRRYEAGQLQSDYENQTYGPSLELPESDLVAMTELVRSSSPPAPLEEIKFNIPAILVLVESSRYFSEISIGEIILEELKKHPAMVPWMKVGLDYHSSNTLDTCLLCGNELTEARKSQLAAALDDKISKLLAELETAHQKILAFAEVTQGAEDRWPKATELYVELQSDYAIAIAKLAKAFAVMRSHLAEANRSIEVRLRQPTNLVAHSLPSGELLKAHNEELIELLVSVNALINQHNVAIAEFAKRQQGARDALKGHYLYLGSSDYLELKRTYDSAVTAEQDIERANEELQNRIRDLSAKVKSHGPAAEYINKLIHAYLGHDELKIVTVDDGYELHRHGKLVRGQPSEGEKTAIALCYFLSTLEAEGRSVKNLIVVVDDPISSLDTKAMNYACALLLNRLKGASQVFVLTHNLHCMNELKKAWRKYSKAEEGKPAIAALLFVDVRMSQATGRRVSVVVEMPTHLRGYDSEYHFLCHKMLQFEAARDGHFEYWFMMPNVIRRVMEIFLAFKVPGSHAIGDKLDSLARKLPEFDRTRLVALERLTQVESHSDSIDDLISHSSMTVEEARDANAAMLVLMSAADADHAQAIRKQCKAA